MFVISSKVEQACRNFCTAPWYQSFKCGHQSVLRPMISHRLGTFNLSAVILTWGSPLHGWCTNYLPRNSYDVIKSQSDVLSLMLILCKPAKKQTYLAFWLACSASGWEHVPQPLRFWNTGNNCLFFHFFFLLFYFYAHVKIRMSKKEVL